MSKRKSIENGRAEAAFKYVQEVKNESFSSEYKSYIKKLAPLIKSNGLGNAIAFVYSNNGKAYGHIYNQLEKWLKEKKLVDKNLLDEILSIDSRKYRYITKETMAILNWWRRFVDGEISNN
jgi:CRISPR-associated protein Cmr5